MIQTCNERPAYLHHVQPSLTLVRAVPKQKPDLISDMPGRVLRLAVDPRRMPGMRGYLLIALLLFHGCAREQVNIPDNAVELRVALCPTVLDDKIEPELFDQALIADNWRLFATPDLEGPLGGLNDVTAFGRPTSDSVWGVLVVDFENTVCEVYASAESATVQ